MPHFHAEDQKAIYAERFQKALSTTNKKLFTWVGARREDGLTSQQFFILKQIADEERMTSSLLAERVEVKPSAITVMIERLVQNGFVERYYDPSDKRLTLLRLSKQGVLTLENVWKQFLDIITQLLAVMEESEIEPFIQSFERISEKASTV
ncbi:MULTISPECIES: MarR family winged helix-turn-helix transcriptional regulator [Paenibacillus]|uniref:HTH marR-type domain-containing protein n=1 Tax=Paenibacillus borealis TaxID=160799 RepID=A0ABX3GSA4_PAEBO|nr:MarR family transcriptional regulator [Paenibacillus borealis]OMD35409.1 hypothetical protein BSK56_32990 [Paenibacillus borealis]